MHSHLIVMTFDREEEAPRVHDALQRMRGSPLPGLGNVAAVTKDSRGTVAVTQKRELSRPGADPPESLLNSAIALLFGELPDETVQALVQEGFDERFRAQVIQSLGNNCSALLIVTPRDSQIDRGRLFGILTLFKGQLLETTLPLNVETVLVQGLEA